MKHNLIKVALFLGAIVLKLMIVIPPIGVAILLVTGIASAMGPLMGPAHMLYEACASIIMPTVIVVMGMWIAIGIADYIQSKLEERSLRKAGLMAVAVVSCLLPIGLQADEIKVISKTSGSYTSLEDSAKLNLEKALVKGSQKEIDVAAKTLDIIVRSRYLSASAEIQETTMILVKEFQPQIESLPGMIKTMGKVGVLGSDSIFQPFGTAIAGWLNANSTETAKLALGDFEGLFQAQIKFDEVWNSTFMSLPYDSSMTYEDKKKKAHAAAAQAADALWASGK